MIRLANMTMPHLPSTLRMSSSPLVPSLPRLSSSSHLVFDLLNINTMTTSTTRPDIVQGGNFKPNAGQSTGQPAANSIIAMEDWNELFFAIQERLENCVNDVVFTKNPEMSLIARKARTKQAVLECVQAMKVLHQSILLTPHMQTVNQLPDLPRPPDGFVRSGQT